MREHNFLRTFGSYSALLLVCVLSFPVNGQLTSPARVSLTGIIGLVKPPRVLLEVEQPGQPPRKLSLREGERDGTLELLSIDPAGNRVRIRNAGIEQELSFVSSAAQSPQSLPVQAARVWDAKTGKPVEPARHTPASVVPFPTAAPIVVGTQPEGAGPRDPNITVVGRRQRVPIPSRLGPRASGAGYGREGFQAAPTRAPRVDGAGVQPQPPQPLSDLDLPPLPEPGQPPPSETVSELPTRRLHRVQMAEPLPLKQLPAPPPPPPQPQPAPPLQWPEVGYRLPFPGLQPGRYGGVITYDNAVGRQLPVDVRQTR